MSRLARRGRLTASLRGCVGPQWLHHGEALEQHDISDGLRDNWNAKRKWKMAISGIQAAMRMRKLQSNPASRRNSFDEGEGEGEGEHSGRPVGLSIQTGVHGGHEDEHTDDEFYEPPTSPLRNRPSIEARTTTDLTAKRASEDLKKDLDSKMQRLLAKTNQMRVGARA